MVSYETYSAIQVKGGESTYTSTSTSTVTLDSILSEEEILNVGSAVIIDFGGKLEFLKENALAHRDLSSIGNSSIL